MNITYRHGGTANITVSNEWLRRKHQEVVGILQGPRPLSADMVARLTGHRRAIEAEMRKRGL